MYFWKASKGFATSSNGGIVKTGQRKLLEKLDTISFLVLPSEKIRKHTIQLQYFKQKSNKIRILLRLAFNSISFDALPINKISDPKTVRK